MDGTFAQIETVLERIERLAEELRADPGGHVRRSTSELRAVFADRGSLEPAVARVRDSVLMLRQENQGGSRREFQVRSHGVDHLQAVVEQQLLPTLRRIGFEV